MANENEQESAQIVAEAKKFASASDSYFRASLDRVKKDLVFVSSVELEKEDRAIRGEPGERLEVVIPLLNNYCNQVINKFRSKPVGISYVATTPEAQEKVELLNAVAKGIQSTGGFHPALITAVDRQTKGGLGYTIMRTDYANNETFDQHIVFEGIANPELVIWDPQDKSLDGGKAEKCIVVEHIGKDVGEAEFGADVCGKRTSGFLADTSWAAPEGSIEVAHLFMLNRTKSKIYKDGDRIIKDARKNTKLRSREVTQVTCKYYKIVGQTVVYETELKISRLPVFPFRGSLIDLASGKQDYVGLTYFGRPAAKLINYSVSQIAERMASTAQTDVYIDFRAVEPHLATYANKNRRKYPFLPIETYDKVNKQPFPAPMVVNQQAQIADAMQTMTEYRSMLSAVLGQPEGGSEIDGPSNRTATEVLTSTRSADLSSFQILDNASLTIKAMGTVLLELIPTTIDTPRLMLTKVGDTEAMQQVDIPALGINPKDYSVDVQAGPLYATQLQEQQSKLLALGSTLGPDGSWALAGDIARTSGLADADQVASKLDAIAAQKLGIPSGNPDEDPDAVAALEQASQALDAVQQQLDEANNYIRIMQTERQVAEIEAKAGIIKQQMSDDTKVYIEQLKIAADNEQQAKEISAQFELKRQEKIGELLKLYASQSQIVLPASGTPQLNAIDGTRVRGL